MMKKKSTALLTLVCMLACQLSANALSKQIGDYEVNVKGSFGTEGANKAYFINVYAPGKNAEDLDNTKDADNTNVLVYHRQHIANENGDYDVKFNIDGSTGTYTVSIYSPVDKAMLEDETFEFINQNEFEAVIESLNSIDSSKDIEDYIDENRAALGFSFNEIAPLDNSEIAEIICNELKKEKFNEKSFSESKNKFRIIALIAALNNGKIENIFDYFDEFASRTGELSKYLKDNDVYVIDGDEQKEITEGISGKSFDTIDDFIDGLWCEFVFEVVKQPNGVDNLREVLKDAESFTGIDESEYSNTKLDKVIGKDFDDVSDLREALEKKDNITGSGSSGGSGGNKNSGNNKGTSIVGQPLGSKGADVTPIPIDVFTDLEDAVWARNSIVMLTNKGILNGKSADKFCPNDYVTREEFAKMLVLAFAPDAEECEISFNDVNKDAWYYPYVAKAFDAGFANGYDNGKFGIGERITRQDMVTMAYRAISNQFTVADDVELQFEDSTDISDYAKEAVLVFTSREIVNGIGDNLFAPLEYATRAQAAKILYGLIQ